LREKPGGNALLAMMCSGRIGCGSLSKQTKLPLRTVHCADAETGLSSIDAIEFDEPRLVTADIAAQRENAEPLIAACLRPIISSLKSRGASGNTTWSFALLE
jgi:hypothetical protein